MVAKLSVLARTRTRTEVGELNAGIGQDFEMVSGESGDESGGIVGSPRFLQTKASINSNRREREYKRAV